MSPKTEERRPARRGFPLIWVGAAALLVVAGVFWLGTHPRGAAEVPPARVVPAEIAAEVSVAEAADRRAAGAFVLDVRQPEEWVEGHIPGSTLIPLGELPSRVGELPRDKEILVVCRSGNRSQTGRDILRRAGLTRSTSMAGGLHDWTAAGYPTVKGQ